MPVDPTPKARLRSLTAAAFEPSRVEATWQPIADKTAGDFVDSLCTCSRPADLMRLLAHPLPVGIMSRVLGLPEDDAPAIWAWSDTLLSVSSADSGQRAAAGTAFTGYLDETISWYREHGEPGTLLADLIAARDGDGNDRLSPDELVATVHTLILAGHEIAASVIGAGVVRLLSSPGEWTRLGSDPDRVPAAVEEILHAVVPCYGTPQLVAEGQGIDYGLGSALAHVELQAAFRVLTERLPGLRLTDPGGVEWTEAKVSGPSELWVDW